LPPIFQRFHYGSMSDVHTHYYLLLFIWKFGGPRLRDMEARFAGLFFYHLHDM
jgi:hypothetical protein